MKRHLVFRFITMFLLAALTAFPALSSAVMLQVDATGQLTGATEVDVLGTLYDVEFVDGTCVALFGGCDEASDFAFTDQASAEAAAQALLDFVFVDNAMGTFDSDPEMTLGITDSFWGAALVPFDFQFPTWLMASAALNDSVEIFDDVAVAIRPYPGGTGNEGTVTYA